MMNLAEYRRTQPAPRRLPALGGAGREGRRPQQGRLLPAHGALPGARSRFRDAGRARRHHVAPQQRAAPSRLRLGGVHRGAARACASLSCRRVSRSGFGAGRCRAARAVRGGRRAFREPLFPDAALAAAGRRRRARRGLALREPRAKAPPTGARRLEGFVDRTDRVLALLEGFMPEAEWLDDGETLTYLHSCISTRRQRVRAARDADVSRRHPGGRGPDRRARTPARPRASAHPDRHGFSVADLARPARRSQPPGLSLPLGDARDLTRQDRRDQAAREDPPPMVRQAQVDHGDPQGGDDQRSVGPDGFRRRQQGARRRRGAAGARLRPRRRGLCHRHRHGLGRGPPASPTSACAWSRRPFRAATSPACAKASTRSRPGSDRCPAMSTPMSASRRSRP